LTGNASTATALATARAINGTNFDGTAAITITAAAGTLTGATLNATVTASSLTSVGTLASLATGVTTVGVAPAANTSGDGLVLSDSTAATSGNQQFSPRIRLTGQGWKTTATAASQTVDWIVENQPVQGTANPTTNLVFSSQVNGGGYSPRAAMGRDTAGTLTVGDGTTTDGFITLRGSTGLTGIQGRTSGDNSTIAAGVVWKIIANGTDTGFFGFGDDLAWVSGGSNRNGVQARQWTASNNGGFGFSSGNMPTVVTFAAVPDTYITRGGAAATVQFGAQDAAAPVAQTIQAQSVVAGTTDTAGQPFKVSASRGTGTAAGGNYIKQTGFSAKSTGTAQHTLVDREIVVAKGKVLTSGVAASLFEVALPTLSMGGGVIEATVVCTDGTDMQSFTQTITYSAVNKGGSYTTSITASTGDKSVSAGTLTNAWSISNGTNKVTIQLTSTTSLTASSNSFLVYYRVKNNSEQATTIL
jgi:hypothetical protein